ncbi:MAG: hypothetical protein EHM16_09595 [Betaproteobacteria bacterium]|nr:MAG: hypothetical protein EHM16_09595 [Betaproteobacteria bacterium]
MKRLIPAVLLLAALNAHADFVRYHEDDEMVSYLDAASITRAGSEARMWTIDDYRQTQTDIPNKPYRSVKSYWIFDCVKRLSDVMTALYYIEGMARGESIHAGTVELRQWDPVTPGTVGELAFKAACAKPAAARPAGAKSAGPPRGAQ